MRNSLIVLGSIIFLIDGSSKSERVSYEFCGIDRETTAMSCIPTAKLLTSGLNCQ